MRYKLFILTAILAICSSHVFADAQKIVEWKLDGNALDSSGLGNHGTIEGAPQFMAGISGQCLDFQGGYDVVYCFDAGNLPVGATNSWSINVFVYADVQLPDLTVIAGFGDPYGTNPQGGVLVGEERYVMNHLGGPFFWGNGDPDLSTAAKYEPQKWNMITVTYDGSTLKMYKSVINDEVVEIGSKATSFVNASNAIYLNPVKWNHFIGKIDEFSIWSGVLTQAQMLQLASVLPDSLTARNPNPANGAASGIHSDIILSWEAPLDVVNPLYNIYVASDEQMTNIVYQSPGQSQLTFDPDPDLQDGTQYFWRVDTVDSVRGTTHTGEVWTFTTLSTGPAAKLLEWNFENNLDDGTGTGNAGIAEGTLAYASGVVGNSAVFNGVDTKVTCQNTGVLPIHAGDSWSMSFYIKPDGDVLPLTSVAGFGPAAWGFKAERYIGKLDWGQIAFYGHSADIVTSTPFSPNQWNLIIVTCEGGTEIKIYKALEGAFDASMIGSAVVSLLDTTDVVKLSAAQWGTYYKGMMDEFVIWDNVLTQEQRQQLAANLNSQTQASELLKWSFENNLNDATPNGNTGTGSGTIAYTEGVSGNALSLNGINSKVECQNTGVLPVSPAASWSMSFYVKPDGEVAPLTSIAGFGAAAWSQQAERYIAKLDFGQAAFYGHGADIVTSSPFIAGQWNLVIVTCENGNMLRIYKTTGTNNSPVEVGSASVTFAQAADVVKISSAQWGNYFKGAIDEFTIWNGVLSASQMTELASLLPAQKVVEWKFEDNTADTSGFGNDAAIEGSSSYQDGIAGKCYVFNGSSGLINTAAQNIPTAADSKWSIGMFVKPQGQVGILTNIGGFGAADMSPRAGRFIAKVDFGEIAFYSHGADLVTAEPFTADQWQLVVVTYDGAALRIYKATQPGQAELLSSAETALFEVSPIVRLGTSLPWGNRFNGLVDEFTIWNGALTEEQIQQISEALPSAADFDKNGTVDFADLNVIADNWLQTNLVSSVPDILVDGFDYSSQAGLLSKWSVYNNTDGLETQGASTITLVDNAMQFGFNLTAVSGPGQCEIVRTTDESIDLSSYNQMLVTLKNDSANSGDGTIYVKFMDGGIGQGYVSGTGYLGGSLQNTSEFVTVSVDLSTLDFIEPGPSNGYYGLEDIMDVRGILVGLYGEQCTGNIRISEIKLVSESVCSGLLDGDLDNDCKVNFSDYVIFANEWAAN